MKKIKIKITVTFRDDKKKSYICVDSPGMGSWITLYLENQQRIHLPSEGIKEISQELVTRAQ